MADKGDSAPASGSAELAARSPAGLKIAATLESATPALDYNQPLHVGDARWVDLSPARTDKARSTMAKKLLRKTSQQKRHIAFVSHRGMGKSTELYHLQQDLGDRYTPLYFTANTEMDPVRVEREDLLLVLAGGVEGWMRRQELPLDEELMQRVARWFDDITKISDWLQHAELGLGVELSAGAQLPLLAKLLAGFKALLRVESETRTTVTKKLRQYPGTLLRSVNQLLEDADKKLRAAGRGELLIIIDNLDRYHPQVIDELLVKGGDQVRQLACNLIVTPPISLQYRPESARLDQYFDVEVMHTPRLRRKEQPYHAFDGPGRDLFEQILARRIDLDALLPEPEARNRLIAATGGSIRDLLRFSHEASLLPEALPMKHADIEAVLARARAEMRDLININGWQEPLIEIARNKELVSHEACLELLYHRLVLKYNGDTWYDLHPLVAEIPAIQQAVEPTDLSGLSASGSGHAGDG